MTGNVCDMAIQNNKKKKILSSVLGTLQTLYFIIVILNVKTGWIFRFDAEEGYIRGPAKNITYI
jgi:hypothetical protein